jgi:hypothetical protein
LGDLESKSTVLGIVARDSKNFATPKHGPPGMYATKGLFS